MKKQLLLLGVVLFSLLGCSNEKVETILLKGEYRSVESVFVKYPHRIGFWGNEHVALLDLASDSCCYHILSYPQLELVYSIGRRGEGPDETLLPTPFCIMENELWTMDGARTTLRHYKVEQKDTILSSMKLQHPMSVDFAMKDRSTVLLEDMSGKCRFFSLNLNTGNVKSLYSIPNQEAEHTKEEAYLWRSYMSYTSSLHKVALASQYGEVLEIYSLDGEVPVIRIEEGGNPHQDKEGFCDVKWYDDCVWALYSGHSRKEKIIRKGRGEEVQEGGNFIKVYTPDGTLKKTYKLDCSINGFDVRKGKVIGVTSNHDDFIVEFEL